jgi:hypothetical protein
LLRVISHRILLILAVPVVFVGLIDPLEGGIALLIAGFIYLLAFLVAGKGPRKYLWIPYVASVVIGVAVLLLAMFGVERVDNEALPGPIVVGVWIYRIAVLATLAGSLSTAILSFRKAR